MPDDTVDPPRHFYMVANPGESSIDFYEVDPTVHRPKVVHQFFVTFDEQQEGTQFPGLQPIDPSGWFTIEAPDPTYARAVALLLFNGDYAKIWGPDEYEQMRETHPAGDFGIRVYRPYSDADAVEYVVKLQRAEQEGESATVDLGPWCAFTMISAIQLAMRHPDMPDSMIDRLGALVHQFRPWFAGTLGEEIFINGLYQAGNLWEKKSGK